jgi:hypothetical protein
VILCLRLQILNKMSVRRMADEDHPVESYQYLYKGDNVGDIPRF